MLVTGYARKSDNSPSVGATVLFKPVDLRRKVGANTLTKNNVQVTTDELGAFSASLAQGSYEVSIDNRDSFKIIVPEGAGPKSITGMIAVSI